MHDHGDDNSDVHTLSNHNFSALDQLALRVKAFGYEGFVKGRGRFWYNEDLLFLEGWNAR